MIVTLIDLIFRFIIFLLAMVLINGDDQATKDYCTYLMENHDKIRGANPSLRVGYSSQEACESTVQINTNMYFIVMTFFFYLPIRIWFFINIRDYRDALKNRLNPDQAELAVSVASLHLADSQVGERPAPGPYHGEIAVGTPVLQPGAQPLSPEQMGGSVNGM